MGQAATKAGAQAVDENVEEMPAVQNSPVIWQQLAASLVALLTAVAAYMLLNFVVVIHDAIRDESPSFLTRVFREFLTPLGGSWIGISVALSVFRRSTPKFVFLAFCTCILLVVGGMLAVGFQLVRDEAFTAMQMAWGLVCAIAPIIGAFVAAKGRGMEL